MNAIAKKRVQFPSAAERTAAMNAQHALAACLPDAAGVKIMQFTSADGSQLSIELPIIALRRLQEVLSEMAHGNAVMVVPLRTDLTIQEAADMLNVSCEYVVRLMDSGVISSQQKGAHRSVKLTELRAYMAKSRQGSAEAMVALTALDQKLL